MQFTPQQLTGGARYGKMVRLGNWCEDLELEDLKLKDYLRKKEGGNLLVNAQQRKLELALPPATLSKPTEEGGLKFGSTIMLVNEKSHGYLAVDPYDEVKKDEIARVAVTTLNSNPVARNTFILERANPNDGFPDDMVHYGQDVVFRCEPFATMAEPAYLHSEHISPLAASKFSRKQEVCMYPKKNGRCLFQFQWPDVKKRFEKEGDIVLVTDDICFRHVHTGSFLASDKIAWRNLFGTEFELHCHNYVGLNKTQNLTSEKRGEITGDYQLRRQAVENVWHVVLG